MLPAESFPGRYGPPTGEIFARFCSTSPIGGRGSGSVQIPILNLERISTPVLFGWFIEKSHPAYPAHLLSLHDRRVEGRPLQSSQASFQQGSRQAARCR